MTRTCLGIFAAGQGLGTQLHLVEFSAIQDEWWTALPRSECDRLGVADGATVDLLMLDTDQVGHIHGVAACSTETADRARLWSLQRHTLGRWCDDADDARLVVVRVRPDPGD